MTTRPHSSRARRAARVLALAPAVLVTTTTGTAFADPPDSWENGPAVSALQTLLVLGGIPVALFLLITLLVYVPSMSRQESSHQPGEVWRGEAEWFGGPSAGLEAVDRASPPAATDGDSGPARGGASGRW